MAKAAKKTKAKNYAPAGRKSAVLFKAPTVEISGPAPFRWKPTQVESLVVGDIVELGGGRRFFTVMVNESRARVVPITAVQREMIVGQGEVRVSFSQTGDGVDISPNSLVKRVNPDELTEDEAIRAARFAEIELSRQMSADEISNEKLERARREQMAATSNEQIAEAPLPMTTKSNKQRNADRLAELKKKGDKAKAAVKAKGGKVPGEKKEKKAKVVKPCACGCGEQTTSYFFPGHDARFKGWLLKIERGQMAVSDLPKSVQKAYEWKKRGDGFIPTKNYKGEPHKGYDIE